MVYIRLSNALYEKMKNYIKQSQIIKINLDKYVPYTIFKRVAIENNLPIHQQVRRPDIISSIQMKNMIQLSKRSPQQIRFIEELNSKRQRRQLNKYRGENNKESVKDLSSSISFAMTFIFSFFLAGITGYYFGIYFLGFDLAKAMMVALVFIMLTIIVETSLYIIKQNKKKKIPQSEKKIEKKKVRISKQKKEQ